MSDSTKDGPMSFSDLADVSETDEGDMTPMDMLPPAGEDHSGIVTISSLELASREADERAVREREEAEMEVMIKEQQALHELYSRLLETTNLFTDPLVPKKKEASDEATAGVNVLADSEKLRRWISVFMIQVKDILTENNISSSSNIVKLIDGLEGEFETVLSYGERHGSLDAEMVKNKVGNLARVLTNLSTAILTHRNENAPWSDLDAYVPELLGVTAVDFQDIDDLKIAFETGYTHQEIMDAMPELLAKIDKPLPYKQVKLDKYAEGNLTVYGINEEKAAWDEVQKILRKLKRTGPKKVE